MAFTYVTITHTFETAADLAAAGTVEFTPIVPMHNGVTVIKKPVTATLSGVGGLSQLLAANTDPDTTPTGTVYQVTERITGQTELTYYVQVPHDAGGSIDLRDLAGWVGGTGSGGGAVSTINGEPPDGAGDIVLSATDVGAQPADADLDGLAGLGDGVPVRTSGTWAAASGTPDGTKFLRDDGTWAVASGGSGYTSENARDDIAAALVAGSNVTITPNDGADTITIAAATSGSSGIPASTVDAKGDLIVGTANDTVARRSVGTDGQMLVADSAQTTGVAWAAAYTDEKAQDASAALFTGGTHSGVSFAYDDTNAKVNATVTVTGNPSGVVADYTGRPDTTGTGTDNRAALQAALDAASSIVNTGSYSDYLNRRSVTVRLAPGHYYFSAPSATGSSLKLPPGVTLDVSDASLYFDYPATARSTWCAIEVGLAGHLMVGKIYTKNSAPAAGSWYDAVRIVQSDGNSRITGYKDSSIKGFQGAAIRGVGAWIAYVAGITFTGCDYGYVASNVGTALGYTVANGAGSPPKRTHTDLRITDCMFVNLRNGGFLGEVSGDTGAVNDYNFDFLGLTLGLRGCTFELIGAPAIQAVSASTVTCTDCGFEEVGATTGGLNVFNNCRSVTFSGMRVNLAGGSAPTAGGGTLQPAPDYVFQFDSTMDFTLDGAYIFNSFSTGMTLADNAPSKSYRISGVESEGDLPVSGIHFGDGMTAMSGTWNAGHLTIGTHHLWVDGTGALRHKATAPTSATDGTVIS